MRVLRSALMLSTLAAGLALSAAGPVSAFPLGRAAAGGELAAQLDEMLPTIQVRSRSGRVAAGVIGGLIVGGLIASQWPRHYYGSYYGYPAYPYYPYYPYPAYRSYPAGDPIAYCMRRFKSYDPYSMTYLGYDGFRHPCP